MFEDYYLDKEEIMHSGSDCSRSEGGEDQNSGLFLFNVKLPFPIKLHALLEDMANSNSRNVVSWQPHGKAFRVHQPEVFARTIMLQYFNQTHYKSFQRQLHIYGFRRIKKGKDMSGYYHSLFRRNKISMSLQMTRVKIKGAAGNNHGHEEIEAPDFYKDTVIMEDHHLPAHCSEKCDFATMLLAKPPPILAGFSGMVTAKNTYRSGDGSRLNACLDFTGNDVASIVVKEEQIEDGDEVCFFEGKRFHSVKTSGPTPAAVEDLCATDRGDCTTRPIADYTMSSKLGR